MSNLIVVTSSMSAAFISNGANVLAWVTWAVGGPAAGLPVAGATVSLWVGQYGSVSGLVDKSKLAGWVLGAWQKTFLWLS